MAKLWVNRKTLQAVVFLTFWLGVSGAVWAVYTPYDREPAAVCTDNAGGVLWDEEFASKYLPLPEFPQVNPTADLYLILDFCHSGGFVGDTQGAQRYVAAACEWDELSWYYTQPPKVPPYHGLFGSAFWSAIGKGMTVNQAYQGGVDNCLRWSTPVKSDPSGLGNNTLTWHEGDVAFLFSSNAQPAFGQGPLDDAASALGGWPSQNVIKKYGTIATSDWENIKSAMDPTNPQHRKVVVFLDDHGVSTDVIKSRHGPLEYQYEFVGSIYRVDNDPKYGIARLLTATHLPIFPTYPDTKNDKYENVTPPMPGWGWAPVGGNLILWYSLNENDTSTWLKAGQAYDFGFDVIPPVHDEIDNWASGCWRLYNHTWVIDDKGWVDNSPLGSGDSVWLEDTLPSQDPSVWPNWVNGGDGWILVPAIIPEPATMLLVSTGVVGLFSYIRRRRVK